MLAAARAFAVEIVKAGRKPITRTHPYTIGAVGTSSFILVKNIHSAVVRQIDYGSDAFWAMSTGVMYAAVCGTLWPVWYPYAIYRHLTSAQKTFTVRDEKYTVRPGSIGWYFAPGVSYIEHRDYTRDRKFFVDRGLLKKE